MPNLEEIHAMTDSGKARQKPHDVLYYELRCIEMEFNAMPAKCSSGITGSDIDIDTDSDRWPHTSQSRRTDDATTHSTLSPLTSQHADVMLCYFTCWMHIY